VEAAHRDDHRIEHVEPPGDHGLQRDHHLARGRDRVGGPVRLGGVPAPAADGDRDLVGGGEHRAWPGGEHPERELARRHVQAERRDRPAAGRVEHALADHVPGAGVALFSRLEHEDHRAGQLGLPGAQQLGRPGQHGHVQVVPARVHDPVVPRRVGKAGRLGDRQRVHVAAQQHHRSRASASQHRGHRAEPLAGGDLKRQPVQRAKHLLLGFRQVKADLRLTVDGLPQQGDLGGDLVCVIPYWHADIVSCPARNRHCPEISSYIQYGS